MGQIIGAHYAPHQRHPPAQGYALRPTNATALSQVSTEELLLELRRRIIAPRPTPRQLGQLGRP